jgi:hypothetical protein
MAGYNIQLWWHWQSCLVATQQITGLTGARAYMPKHDALLSLSEIRSLRVRHAQ